MNNEGCGCVGCIITLIQLLIIGAIGYFGFMIICGLFSILPYVIVLIIIGAMIVGICKIFK